VVELVDMRKELKAGNRSIFSGVLQKAMTTALSNSEQVILFLNRRGAATFVQCRGCGFVMRCHRCGVSLTYHSSEEGLICHQCNYRIQVPAVCPWCMSQYIRFLGIGTQKVEELVQEMFPRARTLRWDRDVSRSKHSDEEILGRFLAHEMDVLVGTQMIAKGLDISLVTLVGVINADLNLYIPDFRAGERTFQLLSQVVGRAGRGVAGGRAIIQTYGPDHYAIQAAARHDYSAFYSQEIDYRRSLRQPPFTRLVSLTYSHINESKCQQETERLAGEIIAHRNAEGMAEPDIIGPAPAFVRRLRGRFRWQIILRGTDPSWLMSSLRLPQGWTVDVNPVSTAEANTA
jgi:primosomal protein N' (replication factor Y)